MLTTTATKIEINLVVTMISPWQAPIIIGRWQSYLHGPIEETVN